MKTNKEAELLHDIQQLLATALSEKERAILLPAEKSLVKQEYLPRIVKSLESALTPLAVSGELSQGVAALYLKITSHTFKDKGFGRGLFTIGGMF